MRFGDWILKEQHGDQVGTEEPMEMLLKGKHKKIVKDALALDDPPGKFDEAFKTMTLEMIHDNVELLNLAMNLFRGDVDIEKNPEKKEWKDATLRDLTDSHNKWKAFEEERMGEFEPPEEETPEEEGGEEAPPEEEV